MEHLEPRIVFAPLALSVALAGLTCFTLLELGRRVRGTDPGIARLWWCGGTFVAGSGLWSAHFVAMQAYVLPLRIGYSPLMTFLSWLCAVGAAGFALGFAVRTPRDPSRLVGRTGLLGATLTILHFTALAAVDLAPGVDWDPRFVAATAGMALVLSATLLCAFTRLADEAGAKAVLLQVVFAAASAALFLGFAAAGMASMRVPADALAFGRNALEGSDVAGLIESTVPLMLFCTLLSSSVYGFVDVRRRALAGSLEHVAARLDSANDELRQRAMLDSLTSLPNRILFEDRLAQSLLRAERAKKSVRGLREKLAVLFIDIDGFKPVNDSFGHAVGDEVIRQVGARLRDAARDDDTVARVGADQFLVLMEGATSSNDCVALATRMLDATKQPMMVGPRRIQTTISIGIVVYPDHGESTKLLAQADSAMQAAKRAGRGTYALFESHMHTDTTDQLDLVNDLRQAIELGQLELHYQPKIDGRRHLICGVEALLRWHHPTRGTVSPAVFIPVAERFGLINALGNWVVDEACRQMEAWAAVGVQMRVAINLSVHQLREHDLVSRIEAALKRHGVRAAQLLCEITESVAMQDIAATQRTLDGLGAIGVYLSIDDFGTGYSSLSYLRQLPARQLKIDRTFINDLDTSDDAKAVVDGVVRLAHALGLRVVAEGVETATQRDILLALNCDELQGFFFARPMSADKLLAWTNGHKPQGTVDFAASLMHRAVEA